MVEHLIKLDRIKKSLNISINIDDEKIFHTMKSGYYSSPDIGFIFDSKEYIVSIHEILDANTIIKITKSYQKQIMLDELPIMDDNSFIFATDIGGDYFVFNATTSTVYYCGELNFYQLSEISMTFSKLISSLSKHSVENECFIFKFTDNEIFSLNHIKNPILADFLSRVQYGLNDIPINYVYNDVICSDTIDFIYGFDYLKTINNTINFKFNFGTTTSGKELYLDLSNGNVIVSVDSFVSNYIDIF